MLAGRMAPAFPVLSIVLCLVLLAGCAVPGDRLEPLRLHARAVDAYEAGENDKALALHRELAEREFASAHAWYRLGNLETAAGNLDAAVEAYHRALAMEPGFPEASHNLGMVYMRRGAEHLRAARPAMRNRSSLRAADQYLAHLLADLIDAVEITLDGEEPAQVSPPDQANDN